KRRGTDRAYVTKKRKGKKKRLGRHKPTVVYGDSYHSGCHRSDVAEIHSAELDVDESINIACSGAATRHILRSSAGGHSWMGESPQADQLAEIARQKNVKYIVLGIGGNDLGFLNIVVNCG